MAVKVVPKWLAQSKPTYVHTHIKNFNHLAKDPEVLDDFRKYLKKVSVDILEDHLDYWTKLREQLIIETNKIREKRGQGELDKDSFIGIMNKQMNSKNSKITTALMEYKRISREILSLLDRLTSNKWKGKKVNTKKKIISDTKNLIDNSWELLIKSLAVIASEFEKIQQSNKITDQKTIKSSDEIEVDSSNIKVVEQTLSELSSLITEISKVLEIDLKGDTVSKQFLDLIKKIKKDSNKMLTKKGDVGREPSFDSNPLLGVMASLATGGKPKYIEGAVPEKTGLLRTLGFSLEVAASQEFVDTFIEQFSPGTRNLRTGNLWYKFSTSDMLVTKINVNIGKTKETTFNYGASLKLTRFPGLSRTYKISSYEDTGYFKSRFVKTTGLKAFALQKYLRSLEYLRANISGLDSFSLPKNEEINPSLKNKYFNIEKDLSGIFTVIRALDGVYDYNQDVRLKEKDTEIYHTAFINIRNNFVWMEDLLRSLIERYKESPKQAFEFKVNSKNFKNKISSKKAQKLWDVKRKEMRRLTKLEKEINYDNLYDAVNSSSIASSIEKLSKKPFNEITVDIKIGNLEIYKNIK